MWARRLGQGFDVVALQRLLALDPTEQAGLLPQLLVVFAESLRSQSAALEDAMGRGDLDGIRRAAHAVRSAARSMGAEGFANACRRLEEHAHSLMGGAESRAAARVLLDAARVLEWARALRLQVQRAMAAAGDGRAIGHGRS